MSETLGPEPLLPTSPAAAVPHQPGPTDRPTGRTPGAPARPPLRPEKPARPGLSLGRRALWSFGDQALSSLTNAALSIVVAREVGQASFGAFSLALVTFSFVIGISRAVVSDVFVIQFSGAAEAERRPAVRRSTGGALAIGVLAGSVCLFAGLLLPHHETRTALLALGLSLPGLLLQDSWRFVFFAADRPAAAFVNDLVWAVVQFSAVGALIVTGRHSIFLITLAWGGAALMAAGVACAQGALLPAPGGALAWFRDNRHLNVRMGLDYVINMGAVNLTTYLIGAFIGLVAVGALRAAQVILGPLQLVYSGSQAFLLPVLSRQAGRGQDLRRTALLVSGAVTAVSATWSASCWPSRTTGARRFSATAGTPPAPCSRCRVWRWWRCRCRSARRWRCARCNDLACNCGSRSPRRR